MKTLKRFLLMMLVLSSIMSCKKDSENEEIVADDTLEKEVISAKWNVDSNSTYESFEFNESGNYIIIKEDSEKSTKEKIILFGTYDITDKVTIVLEDYGTMKISNIEESSISFKITLIGQSSSEVSINATKQNNISNSSRTDLLCKTWEMVSINGENVAGTEMELSVLFSKAGTYFVAFKSDGPENDGNMAQWIWKDTAEQFICYSWDGVPVCDGSNEVEITVLTKESLTLKEGEVLFVMRSSSGSKSETNKNSGIQLPYGLFNNPSISK